MVCITFHHKARFTGQAELRHHRIQIGRLIVSAGGEQHFAAIFQIGLQLAQLVCKAIGRKVRCRVIDDEQFTIIRDGCREQIQRLQADVLCFQRIGQRGSGCLFAVVGRIVSVAFFSTGQLVDRRGDLLFTAEGHVGSTSGVVVRVIVLVQVCRVQHHAVFPADNDQAAGGDIFRTILRCKGRIEGRILPFPVQMAAFFTVVVQQLCDNGVLAAGLTQIINGDILIQTIHQLFGAVAQRVHFGGGKVELRIL